MVKAFILDTAFKNDYQVEWLFVSKNCKTTGFHTIKANIANIDMYPLQWERL
jgi:hypothetical protein